ncbi:MAG: hypothetical protein CMM47_09835 [Rhodospirillaceae bacterium]|nr:hypothetical protein [Rhodospirillaceae bacterium]
MVKQFLAVLACVAVISTGTPSVTLAQSTPNQSESERKLEEGARAVLDGLKLLLKAIPWYGTPNVLPNGDILIPRLDGPPLPKSESNQDEGGKDGNTTRL